MIHLLPDEDKDAQIECKFLNYKLSEKGGGKDLYEALSYVWDNDQEGSAGKCQQIKLDGQPFDITPNLDAALLKLRSHQFDRVLWVDAICINQNDKAEKSTQIPLTRAIYAQADHVIGWLGEAFEDGDKALESIRCLAEDKALGFRSNIIQNKKENKTACLRLLH